ncbi:MAG: hypothetical protein WD972_01790, partial [Candidatus Andersenbacteria bacterium]
MERPLVYRLLIVAGLLLAIFLPRLVSLGTILTVDEPLWQGRGTQFMKGLATGHFEKTLVAGQPGATTAWLVGLVAFYGSLTAAQAMIAIACGGLLALNGYFFIRLWGGYGGSIALLLLALNPFLIAHSRIVHTDALLALSYLGSLT